MDDQLVLQGSLQDLKFPDLLLILFTRKESGELQIKKANGLRRFFFDQGSIIAVITEDPDESLTSFLFIAGKLSFREFEAVRRLTTTQLTAEEVLTSGGFMTDEELHYEASEYARFVLQNMLEERNGEYEFLKGKQPQGDMNKVRLGVPEILAGGAPKMWRWSSIGVFYGVPEERYVRSDEWHAIAVHLSIPPGALSLLSVLETPHSAAEIVQLSPMSEFDTCKWIWCFLMTGILKKAPAVEQEQTEEITLPFLSEITQSDITASQRLASMAEDIRVPSSAAPSVPEAEQTLKLKADQLPGTPVQAEPPEEPLRVATVEMERPVLPPVANQDSGVHRITTKSPPTVELSFADLSEMTDAAQESTGKMPSAKPLSPEERLRKDVNDFNERHRYLYERLRIEVGPQITNYVERAKRKATLKFPLVFDGVHMNEFGEFSERSLVLHIEGNLFERHLEAFRYFLDEERRIVEPHIEAKRMEHIYAGLSKIEARQKKDYLPA